MLWLFTVKLVWRGLDWWFVAFSCSWRLDSVVSSIKSLGVCIIEIRCLFWSYMSSFRCFAISVQFFPTSKEAIDYYNQKRCVDGKALVLPSQIVSQLLLWNAVIFLWIDLPCIFLIILYFSASPRGMSNILSMS